MGHLQKLSNAIMHENVFSYVTLNVNTIVHNKKLTIIIVYRQVIEKNNSKYKSCQFQRCKQVIKFDSAYKISIAILQTKLSLATCAHKSYRSFDAILRFFSYMHPGYETQCNEMK